RGSTTEAIDDLNKGLKTMPDDPGAHFTLGQLLSKTGEADKAIDQYREVLRLKPDDTDTEVNLGMILIQRKQLDEGMEHFARALRIDSNCGIAHNDLALAFYLKGQYAEAWKEIHSAETHGFNPNSALIDALSARMKDPGGASTPQKP
ncbi:MAG: tetratricopeptide repeat protein, partial [Candidatus Krumholzibacteriaceae bacterium]